MTLQARPRDALRPMIRVFLGYDSKETIAYHVACQSIHERSSEPVTIAPLMLSQVKSVFDRERNNKQSTEFSFSRFLVPHLCGFEGWALFADCDVLCVDDIAKLWAMRDDKYAVMCVKHEHIPKETTKFLGQEQTVYEKKNWSSVMLMNTAKCRKLTAEFVNTASGLELHRFHWLESEDLIGELPRRWNFLVDYYDEVPESELSLLHYTEGGPYFEDYRNCGYAGLWLDEYKRTLAPMKVPD